jgi:hypothetical protein
MVVVSLKFPAEESSSHRYCPALFRGPAAWDPSREGQGLFLSSPDGLLFGVQRVHLGMDCVQHSPFGKTGPLLTVLLLEGTVSW